MKQHRTTEFTLAPQDNHRLADLCGECDQHLHTIERTLGVEINARGSFFQLLGPKSNRIKAQNTLRQLYKDTEKGPITSEHVHMLLQEFGHLQQPTHTSPQNQSSRPLKVYTKHGLVKPRGQSQQIYVDNIKKYDINFGIGPAGTGKTYLAVAAAADALINEQIERILLVRPAVEAGERLGFLPGDLSQKVDPYLRPLYDALYEMLGFNEVNKLIEREVIEIAPLAYMRGRTLNDAFIILDEGQNTTTDQMKMFLTRLGFNAKAIITGDITQVDLPKGQLSGLRHVIDILQEVDGIGFTFFKAQDVVRHALVKQIIAAYERKES